VRKPRFRSGQADWGLDPVQATDVLDQFADAAEDCFWYFIAHPVESYRLRRRVPRGGEDLRLSIGCGRTLLPGWIGIDRRGGDGVYRCDLRRPLPFADGSANVILVEHVLEHFPLDDLPTMLADYCRVLRPGGAIRIVSPDAALVADLINGTQSERLAHQARLDEQMYRWPASPDRLLRSANRISHQYGEHKSLLSAEVMRSLLAEAGFSGIVYASADTTTYLIEPPQAHFKRFPDSKLEAFVLEATAGTER
jgi:predicted SAM-dependent methyltransferase